MKMKIVMGLLCLVSTAAFAQDFLDPYYGEPKGLRSINPSEKDLLPPVSDTTTVLSFQSPVKSQGSRGTCSIFSATAILESVLKREGHGEKDLSEEWLEFLIMKGRTSDGSNSSTNFRTFRKYGTVDESVWPYVGQNWTSFGGMIADQRCGHLEGDDEKACLLGHRDHALLELTDEELMFVDPEFYVIRDTARRNKDEFYDKFFTDDSTWIWDESDAKELLLRNIPLTMGITFYYGAWNHGRASSYGIGRDTGAYARGEVGFPEPGSKDYSISPKHRAGHSVVIIGYDDEKVIRTRVQMDDGTYKEFEYKGVYYFKNSWGTGALGSRFEYDGETLPGYGIITQKYAHRYGSFQKLPVNYSHVPSPEPEPIPEPTPMPVDDNPTPEPGDDNPTPPGPGDDNPTPGPGDDNPNPGPGEDGPTPDEPKPDEPKPDEPKPDEPKPDEPKPDEPKPDEPKPDEPKPDDPNNDDNDDEDDDNNN